ncbi:MAG: biopolymer transporter ExbD, partial [Planctomycetales bacterium]
VDEQEALNLTPMIDVVFLLIIFFMVGTKFAEMERSIGLNVPDVSDGGTLTEAPSEKIVNVYQDGLIELDQENVTLPELVVRLETAASQYPELGVLVRGDGATPYQRVAEVFNACKSAGVSQLVMAVRLSTPKRKP